MIQNRADLRRFIDTDLDAHGLPPRWRARYRLTQRTVYFQWLLRRSEYWSNCRRDPIGRIVATALAVRVKLLGERLGFSVPRNVFGPGLAIVHPGTVVVNPGAQVGEYCRIHQDVTIGESSSVLGDRVWIGPGAKIFGNIKVGDRAAVGANAVVFHDVPAGVTVAGIPARVVSKRGSAGLILGKTREPLPS